MNTNSKVLACCVLMLGFIMGSCEKGLELEPKDEISSTLFFKKADDYKLWINNSYTDLPTFAWGRDDWSDIMYTPGGNAISRGEHQAPEVSGVWNGNYRDIFDANVLLEEAANAPEELKPDIAVYVAEARFFRAMAYMNLMNQFGGVPIIDKVLDLESPELFGPRNTRAEVTDFILSDLTAAIADLPLNSELSGDNLGRVSKGAARAFKARVALYAATWAKYHQTGQNVDNLLDQAISASNAVIESSEYTLFDERSTMGDDSYRYLFIMGSAQSNPSNVSKEGQSEFILEARFDASLRSHGSGPESVFGNNPTKKFMDLVLCTDGLPIDKSPLFQGYDMPADEYANRDPRMAVNLMEPFERYYSYAQGLWNIDWTNPADPSKGFDYEVEFGLRTSTGYVPIKFLAEIARPLDWNWPVIRYAEVLLIYAEAVYERNGSISDGDLNKSINLLRERVGMTHLTNGLSSANGLDMLEEIRRERTIELFMEGVRYDDIRRWKIAEDVLPKAVKGVKYTGTAYETDPRWTDFSPVVDSEGFIIVEDEGLRSFDPDKHYLFALPRNEIAKNPALEQNPGWQ
jgi:hypothetical protein